jgi:hypothetical protein
VLVEIQERDQLAVYHDVASVVDRFLRGMPLAPELRLRSADGGIEIRQAATPPPREERVSTPYAVAPRRRRSTLRIFPYAVNRDRLEQAIRMCQVPAHIVNDLDEANMVLTLKSHEKYQSRHLREARARGVPFHVLRNNTVTQMVYFLRSIFDRGDRSTEEEAALQEADAAIRKVRAQAQPVELLPQGTHIRRLQHQLAGQHGLVTHSTGAEPYRRVVIYPEDLR